LDTLARDSWAASGEAVEFHRANSELFDGLCRLDGFEWSDRADLSTMPHIIVTAFKERTLLSVPEEEITHRFTSSGTGGAQSKIFLDDVSFTRQARASLASRWSGVTV
jgi:hypothetical protein